MVMLASYAKKHFIETMAKQMLHMASSVADYTDKYR